MFKKDKEETIDTEEYEIPELDSRCEAELLTKILDAAEKSKEEEKSEKTDGPPAKKMKCHHEEKSTENKHEGKHGSDPNLDLEPFSQLETKPDLSDLSVPKGCTLRVYQGAGSPYVRGALPEGHKWKGKASHNRSFDPSGGASSSSSVPVGSSRQSGGRAVLSEAAAKAAVLAWLWDWAKAQGVCEWARQICWKSQLCLLVCCILNHWTITPGFETCTSYKYILHYIMVAIVSSQWLGNVCSCLVCSTMGNSWVRERKRIESWRQGCEEAAWKGWRDDGPWDFDTYH